MVSITDPVQIVSQFQYSTNDFLNALITPYGKTIFAYSETQGTRQLSATDPFGETECLQYRDTAVIPAEAFMPTNLLVDSTHLGDRNSYYWNKKTWAQYPNDLSKATITHWACQALQTVDIPLYTKNPLESSVWYNYPGQTNIWGEDIRMSQPAVVSKVLDNGSTQTETLAYDGWGNLTNAVDALGRTTLYVYSTNGIDLLAVYQKNGGSQDLLASLNYNGQHLPIKAVAAGVTNTLGYTPAGLLLKATNGLAQVTSFNYDGRGFLTNVTGHVSADVVNLTYDFAGRLYSIANSDGYSITNAYDNLDRITNVAFPDGTAMRYIYDKVDLAQIQGWDRRWTYFNHDATRKLTDVQNPAGHLYHYQWCGCGALENITDPKAQTTSWVRDLQSRPLEKVYADNSAETTTYENLTSRVKQTTDAAGKSVTINYNQDDTVQQVAYSGGPSTPAVNFSYDSSYSRLTKVVDGIGSNVVTYVPAGQPGAGNVQTVDGPLPNDTITFGYDALGRPLTLQIGATAAAVKYDTLGRVYWSSNLLGVTTVQYVEPTSRPSLVTRPDGLFTAFTYTPVADGSRLQSMLMTNAAGTVVQRYDYVYDIRNLITTLTNISGGVTTTWKYDYDLAQELTAATQLTNGVLAHRYSYNYDKAGNRTSEQIDATVATEQANSLNQLLSRTGGGTVRVSGFLNETGTVSIVGVPARMTSPTNFVGEVGYSGNLVAEFG